MPALATPAGRALLVAQRVFTYLLGPFRFSVDQAAPLTSPYTEAGAAGSLTVVDTGNKLSVSGGAINLAGVTSNWADPMLNSGVGYARASGRALLFRVNITSGGQFMVGWTSSVASGLTTLLHTFYIGSSVANGIFYENGANNWAIAGAIVAGTNYDVLLVLRGTGAFLFITGGTFTNWTLLWVDASFTTTPMYATLRNGSATTATLLDNLRIIDLGGIVPAFATDEGLASGRKATSIAGDTLTQTADALVEHTLTAATGVDKDFYVRWTDDNNCWIVRQNQAGSTVKLVEKVAGVETSRMSVAQTFTNGTAYRLIAVCEGSTITVYVNNTKAGAYASATTNQTATTAKAPVSGLEFKAYPRTVTLPSGV